MFFPGNKMAHKAITIFITLAAAAGVPGSALADSYFDEGVKRYAKKDYRSAAAYFEQSLQNSPWDSSAFYYAAVTYQALGDWTRAKEKYRLILERFPGTQACTNATAVLKQLDPDYFKRKKTAPADTGASAGGGGSSKSADDPLADVEITAPPQCRVLVGRQGEKMLVDAQINNRGLKMVLATGSNDLVVGKNHLQALGLKPPTSAPTREAGQTTPSWKLTATVRVGEITEKNFPISVQDNVEQPLLGQNFFDKFTYTIERGGNSIMVTKKGAAGSAASGGSNDVPFKKEGKNMLVDVSINGRTCSMIFDTSGGECAIPKKRAREFGLEVPEETEVNRFDPLNNPTGPLRGESGFGESKKDASCEARTMKMGPIVKSSVKIKLEDAAGTPRVGSGFFGEWQYTIDSAGGVIRFSR